MPRAGRKRLFHNEQVLRAHMELEREIQRITIPSITLHWTPWYQWREVELDARAGGVRVPDSPGVYEVRRADDTHRLTIGKATNLRQRVKQGLIRGKTRHSTGSRIRPSEDKDQLLVRWAITDRPAAVEEELHRLHVLQYGSLPEYTKQT